MNYLFSDLLDIIEIITLASGWLLIISIGLCIVVIPTIIFFYFAWKYTKKFLISQGFDVNGWQKEIAASNRELDKNYPYMWLAVPIIILLISILNK